jgi:hypothetical protein
MDVNTFIKRGGSLPLPAYKTCSEELVTTCRRRVAFGQHFSEKSMTYGFRHCASYLDPENQHHRSL